MSASAAAAGLRPLLGCSAGPDTDAVFPQSVASGDPGPTSVVLWTRVAPARPDAIETVTFEVATDDSFRSIVAQGELSAMPEWDHTLRLKLTGLAPLTTYFYRFGARGVTSRTGRTLTAPEPQADVPLRFALACCQDYVGRYYHAWRLLEEEERTGGPIHFVLFLGDYIYEYETGSDVEFIESGGERNVEIPDGLLVGEEGVLQYKAALSLRDYRALYQRYKSDPDLQRAHERYPFVVVWDDHEFANDCWQDHATDFNEQYGDEKSTARREAATRAFYEYLPVDVPYDSAAGFPDDIQIYRSLRFGRHVELFLMDQRYYRSDHVIPEGPTDNEVGKFLPNSPLGSRVFARKSGFDAREAASGATMLGRPQLDWLITGVTTSDATWKLMGSQGLMAEMLLDLTPFEELPEMFRDRYYFKLDHWDGYRSERAALLSAVADTRNVVVLSGDIHAFYAAELHVDFDAPGPEPAALEFTVSGISSSPVQEQVEKLVETNPLLKQLGFGGLVPLFDEVLKQSGPHFRYASSRAHGIAVVAVTGDVELGATFLEIDDVMTQSPMPPVRRVAFRIPSGRRHIERLE